MKAIPYAIIGLFIGLVAVVIANSSYMTGNRYIFILGFGTMGSGLTAFASICGGQRLINRLALMLVSATVIAICFIPCKPWSLWYWIRSCVSMGYLDFVFWLGWKHADWFQKQ